MAIWGLLFENGCWLDESSIRYARNHVNDMTGKKERIFAVVFGTCIQCDGSSHLSREKK